MKTCPEVYEFLCDNLGQEIDSPECREIHRHLESCAECRRSLEGLRQTVTLFRTAPAPSVSQTTHRRLLTALRTVQHETVPMRPRRTPPSRARDASGRSSLRRRGKR